MQFTRVIYKAQQWVDESSPEEISEVIHPYFEDTEIDMLAASIQRYKEQDSFATDPIFNEEGWETLKDIMEEADELPEDVPYEELVDNSFRSEERRVGKDCGVTMVIKY